MSDERSRSPFDLGQPAGGEEHSGTIEKRFIVGGQPQLHLRNVSGESRITVGSDGEIHVRARKRVRGASEDRAKRLLENVEVRMEQSGDEVSIRPHLYEQDRGWLDLFRGGRVAVDFDIAVPRGTRIDASTVSGDLAVQGTRGSLELQSVSGDVRLADVQGPIRLKTVSGDVSGTDVAGALDANSVSGDLHFDRCRIHGCEVVTVSGDFHLAGELETVREHRFKTISGDVGLDLGGRSYDVRFKTLSGALECTLPGTVTGDGKRDKRVMVGDGLTRVLVKTVSGDLEIHPGHGGMPEASAASSARSAPDPSATERMPPAAAPAQDGTREILERLARGELDVEAAGRALDGARGRR
ncbi:MAG: hypothetical protein NVSMB8_09230 [Candidatus Limnocylindrales bacterium]